MGKIDPKDRLIFALDTKTIVEAERFVDELEGIVHFFKVGIILHTAAGTEFISNMIKKGKNIFLDLKYFDIANTVRDAVRQVAGLGVNLLTVHADRQVMEAAVEGRGNSTLKILAVTLLTNMGISDIRESGITEMIPKELVLRRARMAVECGCDGVISSGHEVAEIRREEGDNLLIVTPGVRQTGALTGGHKRFVTPAEAIQAGADYLVVGRPIREAVTPRSAASAILEEMDKAFQEKI